MSRSRDFVALDILVNGPDIVYPDRYGSSILERVSHPLGGIALDIGSKNDPGVNFPSDCPVREFRVLVLDDWNTTRGLVGRERSVEVVDRDGSFLFEISRSTMVGWKSVDS